MANKQFKPISQSTWPYTEVPTIWPEGSASGDCTRWMHIYPPRSTAELYRPHQKKQNKKKTPTHLILVLLCKCPPKNVPSNTLLSGFFFPRLLQISLPLCAQQRSENPLWQQGKKRQEKKKKKGKDLTTWRTFLEKKSFSWTATQLRFSAFPRTLSTLSPQRGLFWRRLEEFSLRKQSQSQQRVWWDESDNPSQANGMEKQATLKEKVNYIYLKKTKTTLS